MTVTRNTIVRGLMLATGLASLAAAAPASAQQGNRTWVSRTGNDSNICSAEQPCRSFAGAVAKTNDGGEVNCLTPGEFGPSAAPSGSDGNLTIANKSITINCEGVGPAGILSANVAITISVSSGNVVVLNGLDINGLGGGIGIAVSGGGALIVRNTSIRNSLYGILSSGAALTVDNVAIDKASGVGVGVSGGSRATIVRSQISNSGTGIAANANYSGAGGTRVTIVGSQISNSVTGVMADGAMVGSPNSVFVSMRSTTVTNSSSYGVFAKNNAPNPASVTTIAIDDSTISGSSSYGLYASGYPAGMLVNNSTIANNTGGGVFTDSGGVIYGYGNNRLNGNNQKDGSFTGTIAQR